MCNLQSASPSPRVTVVGQLPAAPLGVSAYEPLSLGSSSPSLIFCSPEIAYQTSRSHPIHEQEHRRRGRMTPLSLRWVETIWSLHPKKGCRHLHVQCIVHVYCLTHYWLVLTCNSIRDNTLDYDDNKLLQVQAHVMIHAHVQYVCIVQYMREYWITTLKAVSSCYRGRSVGGPYNNGDIHVIDCYHYNSTCTHVHVYIVYINSTWYYTHDLAVSIFP